MTSRATGFAFVITAALCFVAATAYGQSKLLYKARYDLQINTATESRSVKSRVTVIDGESIPIEIGAYRAEIRVSSTDPGYYVAGFRLLENVDGAWLDSNLAQVSFSGQDGETVGFQWSATGITVIVEFVASGARS